ncbi:MAG: Uma2 family endonuclease, partial [Pirellula sp.]
MSSADKPELVSVEDYLTREEVARFKSEYIDGWIRAMTGASIRHNCIKGNCFILLGNALKNKKCRPYDSDTKVRIEREGIRGFYYPDVQVVCDSNNPLSVFQDLPVLIIEVLSPSTRANDLHEKLEAYQSIPSLECYIVLEQHQPIAYLWRRSKRGWIK